MKKVLILTCSTGEGHNSAARALESVLSSMEIPCQIQDPVSFQSERMQHAVASLYNNMIKKTPSVFGAIYKIGDAYASSSLPSPVYWANAQYADALDRFITENGFDTVICTHLYGMEAMTAIRKHRGGSVPCYGVLTDYVCIPFTTDTDLDGYFVPCEQAKLSLAEKGIPPEKIFLSGIPVDPVFSQRMDRDTARLRLGIPADQKLFLIMTGGVGCENMLGLCDALLDKVRSDAMVYVLTGHNENLKNRLEERYPGDPRLRAIPFTRQVPVYMAAADVLLSKPGGLSSTEAAVANVPLVHIHAIPGCETYNANFYNDNGLAMLARNDSEAVQHAAALAYDPLLAEKMRARQRELIPRYAARTIIEEIAGNEP